MSINEPLAIVRNVAPHLRANIIYSENGNIKRVMMHGSMPFFYPATDEYLLPELTPPDVKQVHVTGKSCRSDVKLESEPFLGIICAHRYFRIS